MKKEKWHQIVHEELGNINGQILDNPADWPVIRESMTTFIENVDKVTKVFNEENKGVQDGEQS
jgi:hypothetical protein